MRVVETGAVQETGWLRCCRLFFDVHAIRLDLISLLSTISRKRRDVTVLVRSIGFSE